MIVRDVTVKEKESLEKKERKLEKDYYAAVKEWAIKNNFEQCAIIGGQLSGSKWENPDLIDIYCDYGLNSMSMLFEITSFEVKLRVDPYAVWQAAHYKKFSTYTYLAFAVSEDEVRSYADGRVLDMAVSLGLGVLTLTSDEDSKTFKEMHIASKNSPNGTEVENILSRYVEKHEQIYNNYKAAASKMRQSILSGINLRLTPIADDNS